MGVDAATKFGRIIEKKRKEMYKDFLSNLIVCFRLFCWAYLFVLVPAYFFFG
jgi:hypothetical protein